jgi:GNAT superfamily N-acetyltransferase
MEHNITVIFNVCRNVSFYNVASTEGHIVGGLFVIPFDVDNSSGAFPGQSFVEICAMNINKPFRRRGYATRLMQSVIKDFAWQWICLQVEQNPSPGNMTTEELFRWYEKLGFVENSPYHEGVGWMHKAPSCSRKFITE